MAVLLLLAVVVRVPGLGETPPLPVREFRSAIMAREIVQRTADDVEPWRREVTLAARSTQEVLEPPIMEYLTAFLWRATGVERLWVPRLLSSIFWVAGGVFVFLAVRGSGLAPWTAWPATAYYLFAPGGVLISRAFQPDALMMLLLAATMWALLGYHRRPDGARLALVTALAGLTILVKVTAAIIIAGAWVVTWAVVRGVPGLLRAWAFWAFALSLLPSAAFYGYGVLFSGELTAQVGMSFQFHVMRLRSYWLQWPLAAADQAGFAFLPLVLVSLFLRSPGRTLWALVGGLSVGYVLTGLAFPYHIHTHPYYSLPLVLVVSLALPAVLDHLPLAVPDARALRARAGIACVAVLLILAGERAFRGPPALLPVESQDDAIRIGELTDHSLRVASVSYGYGLPLQYFGYMAGNEWPRPVEYLFGTNRVIARRSIADRVLQLGFRPEFFVATNLSALDRYNQDLVAFLESSCGVVERAPGYAVWSGCRWEELTELR